MVEARKFDVQMSWVGRVAVLSVVGDVDALTAPDLAEAIFAAQAEKPNAVIVDFSDVEFLASAGMTVLVNAHQELTPEARFLVVAEGPGTSRPIKLMGLDTLFAVHPTLDAALGAGSQSREG
jgi:anti-sigma B factor antagonist